MSYPVDSEVTSVWAIPHRSQSIRILKDVCFSHHFSQFSWRKGWTVPLFSSVSSVNLKWIFNHEALVEYRFINGESSVFCHGEVLLWMFRLLFCLSENPIAHLGRYTSARVASAKNFRCFSFHLCAWNPAINHKLKPKKTQSSNFVNWNP